MSDISLYLSGKKLYGDDFGNAEIAAWFEDEREGYADLGAKELDETQYEYHALNRYHGFRHLPTNVRFEHVLGFGSCFGGEFEPIAKRIDRLTIVDPSDAFVRSNIFGVPCRYLKPEQSGTLPFANETFDLITCFGVLHHIPNVSYVIGELARCLKPGGYAMIREPIVSMGDWRYPRPGLTARERGLPLTVFRSMIARSGLSVSHLGLCVFRPIPMIGDNIKVRVYNFPVIVRLDALVCRLLAWNQRYNAEKFWHKFQPQSAFVVAAKPY